MKLIQSLAVVLVASLTVHCSDSDKGGSAPKQKAIYDGDILALTKISSSGANQANAMTQNAFTKIFGGPSGANVQAYIDVRVKHVFNQQDLKNLRLEPSYLGDLMGWQAPPEKPAGEDDPQTIATNEGTALYYNSRLLKEKISVVAGDVVIPVTSTRVGIVALGDGYAQTTVPIQYQNQATGQITNGTATIPPEYRLSYVVHEARHSDCTGGLSESFVNIVKNAEDLEDALQKAGIEQLQCGHAHVICPSGHAYAGYAACDKETWGAYGVGAVYTFAAKYNYDSESDERVIMDVGHSDQMSRLLKSPSSASSAFSFSSPDMSHSNE